MASSKSLIKSCSFKPKKPLMNYVLRDFFTMYKSNCINERTATLWSITTCNKFCFKTWGSTDAITKSEKGFKQ